jgi:hypothetical protein
MKFKLNIRVALTMEEKIQKAIDNNTIDNFIRITSLNKNSYYSRDWLIRTINKSFPQYIDTLNKYLILK